MGIERKLLNVNHSLVVLVLFIVGRSVQWTYQNKSVRQDV